MKQYVFNNLCFGNNFVEVISMKKQNGSIWQDEEVKTLFRFVEIKKSENLTLVEIFLQFAKCVGREQKSVRNYYYLEIKRLQNDVERANKLGIDLSQHNSKCSLKFTDREAKNLLGNINKLIKDGHSVRGACLILADGDKSKMIRYQNKYRSIIKKENKNMGNIIKMPTTNFMSDEDINALFMGLVKLVKRQECERAKLETQFEIETANNKLKSAIKEIIEKKMQIEKLQAEIKILKQLSEDYKQKEVISRVKVVEKSATQLIDGFLAKHHDRGVTQG